MHEVALCHYTADVQYDPSEELAWDPRAPNAALRCNDTDLQRHSTVTSRLTAFMPSLHASLGADYLKLGDLDRSTEHLVLAHRFAAVLADDGYGQSIRAGITRLADDLASADSPPP